MKRFFFLTIAFVAAAVSCTKGGLMESPQNYAAPISFEPYTGKAPVTKATAVTTLDIADEGFRVIGFEETGGSIDGVKGNPYLKKVVNGQKSDDGETVSAWSYIGPMYWQANQTLSFVAYGLNANTNTEVHEDTGDISAEGDNFVQKASTDFTVFTYTVPTNVADQKDLVISEFLQGNSSSSGTIPVYLYHVLSRVGFKLKIEGSDGIKVIIKNLTLKGTGYKSADFDLTESVVVTEASGETPASVNYNKTPAANTTIAYSLFDSNYAYQTSGTDNYPGFIVESDTILKNEAGEPIDENGEPLEENEMPITKEQVVPICQSTTTFYPGTADVAYDLSKAAASVPTSEELANRYMMFLPQTFADGQIEIIYQLEGGVEQKAEMSLSDFAFAPGKAYEFVFTVSTTAVQFDVDMKDWDTDLNGDKDITNDDINKPLN